MKYGFLRAGAASPPLRVGAIEDNTKEILSCIQKASEIGIELLVFPELSLTGYTCGDLFLQYALRETVLNSLFTLVKESEAFPLVFTVGLPLSHKNNLYNCAAVISGGKLLGIVPKKNLPNYAEFQEARYFAAGPESEEILLQGKAYPFGTNLLFSCISSPDFCFAAEICEDLWVPSPPSVQHALAGATVIANLSASNETVGKANYRRLLVNSHSGRLVCAYVYADAGFGESTTDIVFSGHNLISENGRLLTESKPFSSGLIYQDIDTQLLRQERLHQTTFSNGDDKESTYQTLYFDLPENSERTVRDIAPFPFVPSDSTERENRCEEILSIQATGLATRLTHAGVHSAVVGISGGLDSTLALLVTVRAFSLLGYPLTDIYAITMPGFGTTDRTYENACELSLSLGLTLREIPIRDAVTQHFSDIGHDIHTHDVTYENAQARERTQILMDFSNQVGGLVVGTGDLSELALGWATYNGDHMSMYGVNASIPKTLVRYLVRYIAENNSEKIKNILLDILDTPVSPELLPPKDGKISQQTEDLVGPYELHDFFLFYFLRYGFSPDKILYLSTLVFSESYSPETIQKWLTVFLRRFFTQQFKRSCLPDGPKVGSVGLSPRGDWRMPSDADFKDWLSYLA